MADMSQPEFTRDHGKQALVQKTIREETISFPESNRLSNSNSSSDLHNLQGLEVPEKIICKPSIGSVLWQSLAKLSPKKIVATTVEAYREFQRNRRGEEICHDKLLLKERMYSRVMATFGISEVAGTLILGPTLGLVSQIITRNPNSGIFGTVVGDYVGAVVGFVSAFYVLNKKMYQASSETNLGKIKNLWKDTRPFLGGCAVIAAALYGVDIGVGYGVTALFPDASKFIPMTGIVTALNIAFAEAAYLLLAGAAFSGYSKGALSERAFERYKKYPEVRVRDRIVK